VVTTSSPTAYQATAIWYVRSDKDPRRHYLVAQHPAGYLKCECPNATYRRATPCKHVRAVAAGSVRAAEMKAATTAESAVDTSALSPRPSPVAGERQRPAR
jgi:hypothetical protein